MWIEHIAYDQSEGYLRTLYDRVKGPGDTIDNVMKVHSLRPHTMEGHSALYKSVLHHTGNTLPVEPYFLDKAASYFKDGGINPGFAQIVGEYIYSSSYDIGEWWSTPQIYSSSPYTNAKSNLYVYVYE